MTKTFKDILIGLLACAMIVIAISACDFSARSDLRRAERALQAADKLNAEFWAEREYRRAQEAFSEAMSLARERKINEARDMASIAKDWAEEASLWAKMRADEIEAQRRSLGTYYD